MSESNTNLTDLTDEQKLELRKRLQLNYDVMELHALMAEARARIVKARLEEMAYTLKLDELKNPKDLSDGTNQQVQGEAGAAAR